uniref:EF-hand domain-containing protein n=1 Tax=Urocitellus parryii TaxID=9999 RepID=A0A8D2GV72_UROPR
MSKLLQGIVTVIDVFYQYTTQHGDCDTLNKAELKELLENEFHQILKRNLNLLDSDKDGTISFDEFVLAIFKLHTSQSAPDCFPLDPPQHSHAYIQMQINDSLNSLLNFLKEQITKS